MKRVLFFTLAAAAIVGCQRSPELPNVPENEALTDEILLSAAGTVSLGKATGDTTANYGPRLNEFVLNDQVGIYAVYTKKNNSNIEPDWADAPTTGTARTGRYFDNKPAACTGFETKTSPLTGRWAKFLWGNTGQGGVGIDQLYPKGEDSIFVYAYYPFHKDSMKMSTTEGPRREIRLDTLNPLKQADILWAVGESQAAVPVPYVKRKDPLAPLTFKHALAQLNFKVYRKGAKVAACQFVSIKFRCPVYGQMRITDGNMYITNSTVKDSVGTYSVSEGQVTDTEIKYEANVADISHLLTTPYMVLPLSETQAKACSLEVKLYFGTKSAGEEPANVRTYDIDLTSIKQFVQGSMNTLSLGVGDTNIELLADIEPWDTTNGTDSGLDIE